MALLSVQKALLAGQQLTFNSCAVGGDSFVNSGNVYCIVRNQDASSKTVTFDAPGTDNFGLSGAFADVAVVVVNAQTSIIGPFPPNRFNDANGQVQITYSAVTSLTIAIVSA